MADTWILFFLFLSLCLALKFLFNGKKKPLPPGPPAIPLLGNLLWLTHSVSDIESILRKLRTKYGPIVTIHVGSRPAIFVTDRDLTHKILVQHGAVFSDRPKPPEVTRFISSNQHNISSAAYGPLWRLLRRNLMSEILNPSRVKLYAHGREWVLDILLGKLRAEAGSNGDGVVAPMESFQYAMFCLLVLMCFGEKLDEKVVRDIEDAQRKLLLYFRKLNVFAFVPKIAKYVFRKRWKTIVEMRQRQKEVYLPLIRARRRQQKGRTPGENSFHYSYLDSLLNLDLPEDNGRKLDEDEMISLCSEFLNAGTDTTTTALQWIMANIVKHPRVQAKVLEEINGVVGEGEAIEEEDLHKLPYLKAVILEGLRRHPPGHFVLPHTATEEVSVEGYVIPKNASINFTVAEMNWDGKVWKDPLKFEPERFLAGGEGEAVDITGSREIKMMPFGVGRRICPGLGLAMLHLEYFVANLVREFEWKGVEGEKVDLSEKPEFTVVMKNPLRARIFPRR